MSNEKQHSEQHEALLKKQALEQQEVKEVLVFFQKYTKPLSLALIVICGLIIANSLMKTQRQKKEAKADAAFMQAQTPEAFKAVYEDYKSTAAGPLALMSAAKASFNGGQHAEAEELYNTFVKSYPKHEMVLQAKLNMISCKEAKGQLSEAHLLYGEFAQKQKSSHLAPLALIGKARCLQTLEQYTEAKIVYEDIIVNYPESSWAQMAEGSLKSLAAKK